MMAETPTLYVCHGDDEGPRVHPCRRVQEALRAAEIDYEKVIAAHGHPIPFLRKGSRESAARGDRRHEAAGAQAAGRDDHHPLARHPGLDLAPELTPAVAGPRYRLEAHGTLSAHPVSPLLSALEAMAWL
jgi:hypothetical protein